MGPKSGSAYSAEATALLRALYSARCAAPSSEDGALCVREWAKGRRRADPSKASGTPNESSATGCTSLAAVLCDQSLVLLGGSAGFSRLSNYTQRYLPSNVKGKSRQDNPDVDPLLIIRSCRQSQLRKIGGA